LPELGMTADGIYCVGRSYVCFFKRGPCGDGAYKLVDANGERWEFAFQSFCNSYDLLTFGTLTRRMPAVRSARSVGSRIERRSSLEGRRFTSVG
jgi:hypothetical protein